ncbi:unnamed protein product [Prorocentrum cordatum]|uniref:Uncharacterized protein n=1 Tax=Prorocentrum cordatum TaxID=2364126 RepID=A0ABN9PBN6_9DINO|nr:unnamed protein product [Polarella glacialis]
MRLSRQPVVSPQPRAMGSPGQQLAHGLAPALLPRRGWGVRPGPCSARRWRRSFQAARRWLLAPGGSRSEPQPCVPRPSEMAWRLACASPRRPGPYARRSRSSSSAVSRARCPSSVVEKVVGKFHGSSGMAREPQSDATDVGGGGVLHTAARGADGSFGVGGSVAAAEPVAPSSSWTPTGLRHAPSPTEGLLFQRSYGGRSIVDDRGSDLSGLVRVSVVSLLDDALNRCHVRAMFAILCMERSILPCSLFFPCPGSVLMLYVATGFLA